MIRDLSPSKWLVAGLAAAVVAGAWPAAAPAQVYPPARVRVADRGLAQRQLLETLRGLVEADAAQLATRVDLMIAAYALVNFAEAGDVKLEGRVTAVEQAFETYRQSAAGTVRPAEGVLTDAFQSELEKAFADLDRRPVVQNMQGRIDQLERDVRGLQLQVEQLAQQKPAGAGKREKALAVGGMAATIASVLLLAR